MSGVAEADWSRWRYRRGVGGSSGRPRSAIKMDRPSPSIRNSTSPSLACDPSVVDGVSLRDTIYRDECLNGCCHSCNDERLLGDDLRRGQGVGSEKSAVVVMSPWARSSSSPIRTARRMSTAGGLTTMLGSQYSAQLLFAAGQHGAVTESARRRSW